MTRKEKRARNLKQRKEIISFMVGSVVKKTKINGILPENALTAVYNTMLNVDVTLKENIRLSLPAAIDELNAKHYMEIDKSDIVENIPKPMTREELNAQQRFIEQERKKEQRRVARLKEEQIENETDVDSEIFSMFKRLCT